MIFVTKYGFNMYAVMLQQLYNWQIDWDFMLVYLPSARIRLSDIKPAVYCDPLPLRSCYSLIEGWLFSPVVSDMHRLHHNQPCLDTLTQLTPWLLRVHPGGPPSVRARPPIVARAVARRGPRRTRARRLGVAAHRRHRAALLSGAT
jgi:hypothetical protein